MRMLVLVALGLAGCAQLQAQRGPSWLRAQQGWMADRIVCLGHSGADGGVRAADWAAARCTAGIANAWLNPIIDKQIADRAKAKRTFEVLGRLAKVTDRYTDPATGEVVSRMELTAEEVDRQLQRELMEEQDLLGLMRPEIAKGAKGLKAKPMDPPWLKDRWAKLEPQAELSERVRKDLEAQEAARLEAAQAADAKDEEKVVVEPQSSAAAPNGEKAELKNNAVKADDQPAAKKSAKETPEAIKPKSKSAGSPPAAAKKPPAAAKKPPSAAKKKSEKTEKPKTKSKAKPAPKAVKPPAKKD